MDWRHFVFSWDHLSLLIRYKLNRFFLENLQFVSFGLTLIIHRVGEGVRYGDTRRGLSRLSQICDILVCQQGLAVECSGSPRLHCLSHRYVWQHVTTYSIPVNNIEQYLVELNKNIILCFQFRHPEISEMSDKKKSKSPMLISSLGTYQSAKFLQNTDLFWTRKKYKRRSHVNVNESF